MKQPYIPDPFNQILGQKHGMLTRAKRFALGTLCDPATGQPAPTDAQLKNQLKLVQINAAASGDNVIIPALAGDKEIFELFLWNVTQQTLVLQQGSSQGGMAIVQTRLTNFPDLSGFILGFNGSFQQPHFVIDNGQSLVLNLQNGTQVDGFVRYRVQNGTA